MTNVPAQGGHRTDLLPDMARVVGRLTADHNSRALDRTLVAVGYVPASRAFLQDHVTRIGAEAADAAAELEQAARDDEAPPRGVALVSCGLDRMAVRMSEIVEGEPRTRAEPYERAPPPPSEQRYRMAWVGSTTAYDRKGDELAPGGARPRPTPILRTSPTASARTWRGSST